MVGTTGLGTEREVEHGCQGGRSGRRTKEVGTDGNNSYSSRVVGRKRTKFKSSRKGRTKIT